MHQKLVFMGAGAHLPVALEVARLQDMALAGVIDNALTVGDNRHGLRVIGDDSQIAPMIAANCAFHITLTEPRLRCKLRRTIESLGGHLISLVHPRAIVSSLANVAEGCFIAAGAIVNPLAKLSSSVVVNTGAQIDHDCQVGADCHIGPGAILAGNVTCGERVFVASGAIIAPNIRIGSECIIGAGTIVRHDVPDNDRLLGAPTRESR